MQRSLLASPILTPGPRGGRPRPSRRHFVGLAAVLVLMMGVSRYSGFLPAQEGGDDGFQAQLTHVVAMIQAQGLWDASAESWLIWVHLARFIAVSPFMAADAIVGPLGSLCLLLLLLLPLVKYRPIDANRLLALLPLLLPLLVSGRSVQVAAGVGYIIVFLISGTSSLFLLWLGVLLVNLSSASVLTSILLLLFVHRDTSKSLWHRSNIWLALGVLSFSFFASLVDKLAGFLDGDAGYESFAFASDNLVLAALSRSTLLVSIVDGQYMRAFAYLLIAVFLIFKLLIVVREPRAALARRILLSCFPGLLMEGLGVLALFFPLYWMLLGRGAWGVDRKIHGRFMRRPRPVVKPSPPPSLLAQ